MSPPFALVALAESLEGFRGDIGHGRCAAAAATARELATVDADGTESWLACAELLDLLVAGDPRGAFMHAFGSTLPWAIHDDVMTLLYAELVRANESLLALAAHNWARGAGPGSEHQLAKLRHELDAPLDVDAAQRTRAVAELVLAHFHDRAEAGELVALRARAAALVDLDRRDDALAALRTAIARHRDSYATQSELADLLGELDQPEERRGMLAELSARFPTRPEPASHLADDLAGDRLGSVGLLEEASRWYAISLERRFDEAVVLAFARVLERLGSIQATIALLEDGYARTQDPDHREQFARELARLHPEQDKRWAKAVEGHVATRERGYAGAAIGLMAILLALLLAVLLFG